MSGGYAGKFLWVDLTTGDLVDEVCADELYRDFLGGYGLAARLLYSRQQPKIHPLGQSNILSIVTGPLTGSPAPTGNRWTVCAKSPLTNTWGDANAGGFFGPKLKASGYDGIFVTGISDVPVYLCIENNKATLRDAMRIWGLDTYQIEDWVKSELGKDFEAICIGPAGEKLSLISSIVHLKGRVAGRSGLGAVMGSKRIKAIVVRGENSPQVAAPESAIKLRQKYLRQIKDGVGLADTYTSTGTPGFIQVGVEIGDSPTRNWTGVGPIDFAPQVEKINFDAISKMGKKRRSCWQCPIACWGDLKVKIGAKEIYTHVPEYETVAAFGSNLLNDDLSSIILANEICNRNGIDTISAGSTIAFTIECYKNGLLDDADTGGIELDWGNSDSIIEMLQQIIRREQGLGDILADGVQIAARKIGKESEQYAIHIGGQELPMHDPRFEPALGLIYQMDATPGRHTQGSNWFWAEGLKIDAPAFGEKREKQSERGKAYRVVSSINHVMNSSGLCLFGYLSTYIDLLPEFLTAVTGHMYTLEDLIIVGDRIANIRQAFNVREGHKPLKMKIPARAFGIPPLEKGPTADSKVDLEQLRSEYLKTMGWTDREAIPTFNTLVGLGLTDVADDLW
jgi:aldehyde:ferredoxin oxidoreductase